MSNTPPPIHGDFCTKWWWLKQLPKQQPIKKPKQQRNLQMNGGFCWLLLAEDVGQEELHRITG